MFELRSDLFTIKTCRSKRWTEKFSYESRGEVNRTIKKNV